MSRTAWARLAGFMFLFYIATALPEMLLFSNASTGESISARLGNIAQNASAVRLAVVLSVITIFDAIVLAVALYAITREVEPNLAVMALSCRVGEGIISAIRPVAMLGLLRISATAPATDGTALASFLLKVPGWTTLISGTVFAAGSVVFCILFLRGRIVPAWLAWLGLAGSLILLIAQPVQLIGVLRGTAAQLVWLPVFIFEVVLGFWLLIRGVRTP